MSPQQIAQAADSASRRPRPDLDVPYASAQSGLEQTLLEVWAEVLEYDRLGRDDNFFSLGGDSLQMTQIGARVLEKTGLEISFADFFAHPTAALLAQQLSSLSSSGACAPDQNR